MSGSDNSSTGMKIIRDENEKIIKTAEGILCECVDSGGNVKLKFVGARLTCSTSSSATENASIIPCSTASFNNEETIKKGNDSHGVAWTDNESKVLLQLYYENIGEIDPFSTFKNKKCMWEFISNEVTRKCGIFCSSLQCEYRYKNMLQRRNAAKKYNKKSGHEKCDRI